MNNSTDSLVRFVTAVRIALKTWTRFLPFRRPMPPECLSRDFVVPVFVSMVIHSFLAYLLWTVISDRTTVEPAVPAVDTPLILSLSTFTAASHDGADLEVVSEVTYTDLPAQPSQSSPKPSPGIELKSRAENEVTSKDQGVPDSDASEDNSPATGVTPSFDLEAAFNMKWDFGIKPTFEAETVVTSKGQGVPGSEASERKSITACLTPLFSLEAYYCMEREFGRGAESEAQAVIFRSGMLSIKNYIAENSDPRRNCRTAYAGKGLLAFPYLIRDAITGNGCKWGPELKGERQGGMIKRVTADTYETLLPFKVSDNKIIINITKEGEICTKGVRLGLNAIKGIMEVFRDEYPDGSVIITYDNDSLYEIALEVFNRVTAAKVKMVVVASTKEK